MTHPPPPRPAVDTAPIDNFAQCHTGILTLLEAFSGLPALLEPAARARRIAGDMLSFFRSAVFEHHAEEEAELFPAVLSSAVAGAERDRVQTMIDRLTHDHRDIEAAWERIEPSLKDVAHGRDSSLDAPAAAALVERYQAHAAYEETNFLPLSQLILGRNGDRMAALGMSLHLRHAVPALLSRFGGRI